MTDPTLPGAHARRVLQGLLLLTAAALLLLLLLLHGPRAWHVGPLPLELAASAATFKQTLQADWQQAPKPEDSMNVCGVLRPHDNKPVSQGQVPDFSTLRCNLLFDSVLFVPGYVGLLVFMTLALAPAASPGQTRRRALRQLLCVSAVAAGLFDIAENGMTGRALDDLLGFVLADDTVADVRHASQVKWFLLGLALATIAWLAWRAAARGRRGHRVAAVAAAASALALGAGAWLAQAELLGIGMLAAALAVGVLARVMLRPPAV